VPVMLRNSDLGRVLKNQFPTSKTHEFRGKTQDHS